MFPLSPLNFIILCRNHLRYFDMIPRSPPLNDGYSTAPVKKPFSNNAVVEELWSIQEMDRVHAMANAYRTMYHVLLKLREKERAFYSQKRHWSRDKRVARKKELQELRASTFQTILSAEISLRANGFEK